MPLAFDSWFEALERRHTQNLTFQEIRRSVQALSSLYVERRDRIAHGAAFTGAGKRAAFGLFFGPLHFLLVREVVRALDAGHRKIDEIIDLGCGTGSAGIAWAAECEGSPRLLGIDCNSWALEETRWSYRTLGLRGKARKADADSTPIPAKAGVISAFTANELETDARSRVLDNLIRAREKGSPILIVEPIARRVAEWWPEWEERFRENGGRTDEWRFKVTLPERLALMDRAAGLHHQELTARSLWLE